MRYLDLYPGNAARASICLAVFSTTSIFGQSLQPSQCVRPAVTPPAAFVQTPLSSSLPAATTFNVRLLGATGNGTTVDSDVIQSIIDRNPTGTIYFPAGNYLLHNLYHPGLEFNHFHGTAVMQSGARFVCDTIATPVAASCISFVNSSNVTVGNFQIGYAGDSALPFSRDAGGNTAMLIANSQNVTVTNTTIEHSPGPGIWVANSTGTQFLGGTSVNNTTGDGLHFENVGSAVVNGFYSQNTGDDALEWNNTTSATVLCGLQASNIQIYRSLSSGIGVRGGCGSTFSNFYIDTTANSGIIVAQDPNFGTLVPNGAAFNNGVALNSGRLSSPVVSGKDCIDVGPSQGVSFNNVACVNPLVDGARINGNANAVTLNNVTVDAAPNVSFDIAYATNVWLTNTVSRNAAGGGYVFINVAGGSVSGASACSSGAYGFYHANASSLAETNLVAYDSSEGNAPNRAWWAENGSSRLLLQGMSLIDDVTTTPIVVGEVGGKNTVNIVKVSLQSPRATFVISHLP